MKRVIIFCLSVLCAASIYSQSLKSSVCIVQPSAGDENIKYISELCTKLEKGSRGRYKNDSCRLNWITGSLYRAGGKSFVAGFPVRLSDNSAAVITTAWPFEYADRAKVTLLKDDGVVQELDNLPVVRKKGGFNFTLIKLPENFDVTPLKFFTGELHEGDEVCSVFIEGDSVSIFRKGYIHNPGYKTGTILHSIMPVYSGEKRCTLYGEPLIVIKNGVPFCAGMIIENTSSSSNFSKAETVKTIQAFLDAEDSDGPDFLTSSDINEAVSDFSAAFNEKSALDAARRIKKYIDLSFAKEYAGGLILKYYSKLSKEERDFIDDEFKSNVWSGIRSVAAVYIARKMYDAKGKVVSEIKEDGSYYSVTFSHEDMKPLLTLWKNSFGVHITSFEPLLSETFPEKLKDSKKYDSFFGFSTFSDTDLDFCLNLKGGVLLPLEGEKKNEVNGGFASVSLEYAFFNLGIFFQNEETEITVNKEVKNCSMNSGGFSFKVFIPFRIWRLGVFPWWEGKAGIANIEGLFGDDTFRIVSSSGLGLDFVLLLDSTVNPYFSVSAVTTEYNERDASNNLNIAGGIRLYLADF